MDELSWTQVGCSARVAGCTYPQQHPEQETELCRSH